MVGLSHSRASIGGGSVVGSFGPNAAPSETDAETFDDGTEDFGDYEDWKYSEIMSTL